MKAITIWQPWASLIACGVKQYETRSWPTKYRGPIAIHAAAMDMVRRQPMKKELCVPCAIKLAGTKDVRKTAHRKEKITCDECGRRRYGGVYEVTDKEEKA